MIRSQLLSGSITVEIVSADISVLLTEICGNGIVLKNIQNVDFLTVSAIVERTQYGKLCAFAETKGAKIRVLGKTGLFWRLALFKKRPVLLAGLACIFFLTAWIPSRVLFVYVTGNNRVPTNLILECAEISGIRFGVSRREVRSETIKNSMLDQIPTLQWVGVNTQGCVAEISVKERPEQQATAQQMRVCSIVAQRDGVITSCTATRGDLLCIPGQAVQKGEILISGFTDVGVCIRATRAEGEVFATTQRDLTLVAPVNYIEKGQVDSRSWNVSLLFGKKRINLYNESGILGSICDRIYTTKYITLPGGFQLPFGMAVEEVRTYASAEAAAAEDDAELTAMEAAEYYLTTQMISGQILRNVVRTEMREGVLLLSGRYICSEMIGITKQEEIITDYGEDYGKDRERGTG